MQKKRPGTFGVQLAFQCEGAQAQVRRGLAAAPSPLAHTPGPDESAALRPQRRRQRPAQQQAATVQQGGHGQALGAPGGVRALGGG